MEFIYRGWVSCFGLILGGVGSNGGWGVPDRVNGEVSGFWIVLSKNGTGLAQLEARRSETRMKGFLVSKIDTVVVRLVYSLMAAVLLSSFASRSLAADSDDKAKCSFADTVSFALSTPGLKYEGIDIPAAIKNRTISLELGKINDTEVMKTFSEKLDRQSQTCAGINPETNLDATACNEAKDKQTEAEKAFSKACSEAKLGSRSQCIEHFVRCEECKNLDDDDAYYSERCEKLQAGGEEYDEFDDDVEDTSDAEELLEGLGGAVQGRSASGGRKVVGNLSEKRRQYKLCPVIAQDDLDGYREQVESKESEKREAITSMICRPTRIN